MLRRSTLAAAFFCLFAVNAVRAWDSAGLAWRQTDTSVALVQGERTVWQFNFDPKEAKPYFHPLTANDGTVLTALSPADHRWHRGLWWSWKFINGVNYWNEDQAGQSAGKTTVTGVKVTTHADFSASIHLTLTYAAPDEPAVLLENRQLDVSRPDAGGGYTITWKSTFTAGDKPVVLDRTPPPGEPGGAASGGYAGLSLRLSDAAADWDFLDSERGRGEAAIHGRTARYVKYGAPDGLGFWLWDDDKANPRFPSTWYASRKLRYVSPSFLFRAPFTLAPGRTVDFAYRVMVQTERRAAPAAAAETLITLSSVPGEMRYDLESFQVAPGARVKLRFKNPDDMLHNVVICQAPPDFAERLGQAVLALGEDALAKNYVPDLPEVLFHSKLVEPGREEVLEFTAPSAPGAYPFFCTMPGHWLRMQGVMQVDATASPGGQTVQAPPTARLPEQELVVKDQARLDRLPLPDVPASAFAVGLPDGLNYCFDPETLSVRYAWTGRYLDVAPYYHRRGGEIVKLLGPRFDVGYAGPSLTLGTKAQPIRLFRGYRPAPEPTLLYSIDGVAVAQTVANAAPGIRYTFEVGATAGPIRFKINPAGLRMTSTAGTWHEGELTVGANPTQPTTFSITLVPEKPAHHSGHD